MKTEIFSKTGNRFKANLHCHTVFSDGVKTPEEIKKFTAPKAIRLWRSATTTFWWTTAN